MSAPQSLAHLIDTHRALVCVGTGGVGKTTLAAALGVAGALRGKRVMVLTIDPARQLARALGLSTLARHGESVDLSGLMEPAAPGRPTGSLHAAMLDQKAAWDAFITRHATSEGLRDALLDNPFYQQLSQSLAGSTEYMAIEELCHLEQSGAYDLLIVDTPPATHAIDFLEAPKRIERLLDPAVTRWLARPYAQLGRGALHAMSATARLTVALLERAAGTRTLTQIAAFFAALDGLLEDIQDRAARARALLASDTTGFVLVSAPGEGLLAEGAALLTLLAHLDIDLRAVVLNRTHPLPKGDLPPAQLERVLSEACADAPDLAQAAAWLRGAYQDAHALNAAEQRQMQSLRVRIPAEAAWVEVPELEGDTHSLRALRALAAAMGAIE